MSVVLIITILSLFFLYFVVWMAHRVVNIRPIYLMDFHALIWILVSVYAFVMAGPYAIFNCWTIILIYVPPVAFIIFVILGFAIFKIWRGRSNEKLRETVGYLYASHILVLIGGIIVATVSAQFGAKESVSCL